MSTPKKQPNGLYRDTVYLGKDIYGKKKYRNIYGKTEKECKDKVIDFKYKLQHNQIEIEIAKKKNSNKKFEEYFDEWLDNRDDINENTVEEYRSVKKCHLQKLLSIPMNKLTNSMIKQFYKDLKKEKGEKIVTRVSRRLNPFLKAMVVNEDCKLPRNILDNLELPKKRKIKHYIIKEDQYKQFSETLKKEFYNNTNIGFLYPLVLIASGCGLRIGEALALNMNDIDIEKNCITVNKHQTNLKGKGYVIVEGAKTEAGVRKVAIPKFIKDDLVNIIVHNKRNQKKLEKINKNFISPQVLYISKDKKEIYINTYNFFIVSSTFKMIPKNTAERNWKIFRENLGYTEQIRIHDMRRFLATLFLKKGIPTKVAIAQMGHAIAEDTEYYQDVDIDIQNVYIKDLEF